MMGMKPTLVGSAGVGILKMLGLLGDVEPDAGSMGFWTYKSGYLVWTRPG